MKPIKQYIFVSLSAVLALLILSGCGGGGGTTGNNNTNNNNNNNNTPPPAAKLYVSGVTASLDGQIGTYPSTTFASGALATSRSITGANTKLTAPSNSGVRELALDATNDRLYAINLSTNSILVFDGASQADGNVAPAREITGANTLLDSPMAIYLDNANNRLYVSNFRSTAQTVLVFDNASTINGNVAPARVISGFALKPYSQLAGIQVDTVRNILYVADAGYGALYILDNASTLDGTVTASRVLTGTSTTISFPRALALDSSGNRIYVSSGTNKGSILVFDNASSATGNIAPSRSINTADPLFDVSGLFLDTTHDRLYALNASYRKLEYFDSASSASGLLTPTVTGDLSDLLSPYGIFVDTR